MLEVSVNSTKKVDCPFARSSFAPILVNILSTTHKLAFEAGTAHPFVFYNFNFLKNKKSLGYQSEPSPISPQLVYFIIKKKLTLLGMHLPYKGTFPSHIRSFIQFVLKENNFQLKIF